MDDEAEGGSTIERQYFRWPGPPGWLTASDSEPSCQDSGPFSPRNNAQVDEPARNTMDVTPRRRQQGAGNERRMCMALTELEHNVRN